MGPLLAFDPVLGVLEDDNLRFDTSPPAPAAAAAAMAASREDRAEGSSVSESRPASFLWRRRSSSSRNKSAMAELRSKESPKYSASEIPNGSTLTDRPATPERPFVLLSSRDGGIGDADADERDPKSTPKGPVSSPDQARSPIRGEGPELT